MFSKNIKSILIVPMLLVVVLSAVVLNAECDMMAMISKSGELISNIEDPDGDLEDDFDDPVDFFDYIRERSGTNYNNYVLATKSNVDGYGFSYYKENDYNVPCFYPEIWNPLNQTWYLHGEGNVYYQGDVLNITPQANWPLNVTESIVLNYINYSTSYSPNLQDNDLNTATTLLGHARNGTGGTGNHPFRFEHNDRTYIFMHNGALDTQFETAVRNYLINSGWFDDHSSCWNVTPSNMVDSELLFHYLMKFMKDNNDDFVSGFHDAITQTDIEGCNIRDKIEFPDPSVLIEDNNADSYTNVINFVLSDGENLYVFRNSPSDDSWHELSYKDNDTFYSVKTLDPRGGNIMDKLDFVILSRDEEPIVYSNFLEMKIFSEGYSWDSFPLLERDATINEVVDVVPILETIEPFEDITDIGIHADNDDILDLVYDYWGAPQWQPEDYDIQSTRLYKIKADPYVERTLELSGTRMEADYELEYTLYPYTYQWLGYWLLESQNIVDAFGDLWQYVEKVKSEDWYYNKCSIIRGDEIATPVSWSSKNKTLEYGKGYMVWFKDTPPITNFQWTTSDATEEPITKDTSESFTYIEKADYEVIDVVNIPSNVTEIGIYQDDVCVGAVVVQDSCEQILVYSEGSNREPIPLDFEIVTNNREMNFPLKNYKVYNSNSGKFENGYVIAGQQENSVIMFGDIGDPQNETPVVEAIQLNRNYPNPFNPATTISFSLPNKEDIELTIFNIKGQKVKTLYSGFAEEGEHTITWSGKDSNDKSVGSGLYFYKLTTNNNVLTRKMLMMK